MRERDFLSFKRDLRQQKISQHGFGSRQNIARPSGLLGMDETIDKRTIGFDHIVDQLEGIQRVAVVDAKTGKQPDPDNSSRNARAHHSVTIVEMRVDPLFRNIAAKFLPHKRTPVESRRLRFAVFGIARANNLSERTKSFRLLFNASSDIGCLLLFCKIFEQAGLLQDFLSNDRLPQVFLFRKAEGDLLFRALRKAVVSFVGKRDGCWKMFFVANDKRDALYREGGNQVSGEDGLLGMDENACEVGEGNAIKLFSLSQHTERIVAEREA